MDSTTLYLVPQIVPATDATPARKRPRPPVRKPHRGVFLMAPEPPKQPRWRARYVDPETGKLTRDVLTDDEGKNADTRRDYAVKVHKRIRDRRDKIRAGARPHAEADLVLFGTLEKPGAIDRYFELWGKRLRPGTRDNYRATCDRFRDWCATNAIRVVRQLSKGHLVQFAAARAAEPILASTVNRDLKNLSAVLNKLRAAEILRLTRDDIADGLDLLETETERREFVRADQLLEIIAACRRHDAAQPAAPPTLPLVLFILLTGLRVSEALGIQWGDVGVDAIEVRSSVAKTRASRSIDLDISPLLKAIVSEAKNHRPDELVLGDWSRWRIQAARKLLATVYGSPAFTSQALRCTCGTFLTCAPSVFGAASAHMSARRLGHSVVIAEKHYTGVVKNIPHDARTIEAAMRLDVTPASCPRL